MNRPIQLFFFVNESIFYYLEGKIFSSSSEISGHSCEFFAFSVVLNQDDGAKDAVKPEKNDFRSRFLGFYFNFLAGIISAEIFRLLLRFPASS